MVQQYQIRLCVKIRFKSFKRLHEEGKRSQILFEAILNLIQKCLNLISPLAISLLKIDKGLISLSNTAEAEGRVQGADKNRQKHKKPEVAEGEKRKKH